MNETDHVNFQSLENAGVNVRKDAPLSDYTTFRLGGICPALLTCMTPEQVQSSVAFCLSEKMPFLLIGAGSNLVVSDKGTDRTVIRYFSNVPSIERDGSDLTVSAGTLLDDLVAYAVENGLEGLNNMSGIPGTVGGAVVGNAGAFGAQVGDVVLSAQILDADGQFKQLDVAGMGLAYRHSRFKETGEVIVRVRFALKPGDRQALQKQRDDILVMRREKHPDWRITPSAGSFFRNIEPTSKAGKREAAGWFLEKTGVNGMRCGGATVFERHANIIVGSPKCRAQDVYDLSLQMAEAVKALYKIDLIREVRFVGKFKGMPEDIDRAVW